MKVPWLDLTQPSRDMWRSLTVGKLADQDIGPWAMHNYRMLLEQGVPAHIAAEVVAGGSYPISQFAPGLLRVRGGIGPIFNVRHRARTLPNGEEIRLKGPSASPERWVPTFHSTGRWGYRPQAPAFTLPPELYVGDQAIGTHQRLALLDRGKRPMLSRTGLPIFAPFGVGAHEGTHLAFQRMLNRLYGPDLKLAPQGMKRSVAEAWRQPQNPAARDVHRSLTALMQRGRADPPYGGFLSTYGPYPQQSFNRRMYEGGQNLGRQALHEVMADTGAALAAGQRPQSLPPVARPAARALLNQTRAGLGRITPGAALLGMVAVPAATAGVNWLVDQLTGD